jgi:hypothetical protein
MQFRRLDPRDPLNAKLAAPAPASAPARHDLPTDDDEVIDAIRSVPEHFADLTITAANVLLVSGNKTGGTAGAALTIGLPVYLDTNNLWQIADSNAAGKDAATGITLSQAAAANQPVTVLADSSGSAVLGFGAILTAGETYIVSATAGGIAPITDAATGWKVCILGIALTTSNLKLIFFAGDTAHA